MNIIINYNNELGYYVYVICDYDDPEEWLESFKSYEDAIQYCNNNNYNIIKFIKG